MLFQSRNERGSYMFFGGFFGGGVRFRFLVWTSPNGMGSGGTEDEALLTTREAVKLCG